ncbi:uncharacterized protein BDCG_17041 [Blastomyces dermatitidis ER-3]|nr:uncharacterized protein BDCG_17041 [Blastomyces dermatitidis ER-3]OAT01328.1 hypothetical protein BDCG_17041 [Blastomyces dermatitidis ER-3]
MQNVYSATAEAYMGKSTVRCSNDREYIADYHLPNNKTPIRVFLLNDLRNERQQKELCVLEPIPEAVGKSYRPLLNDKGRALGNGKLLLKAKT